MGLYRSKWANYGLTFGVFFSNGLTNGLTGGLTDSPYFQNSLSVFTLLMQGVQFSNWALFAFSGLFFEYRKDVFMPKNPAATLGIIRYVVVMVYRRCPSKKGF